MTDLFARSATVSLQDKLFVEFLPENGLPVSFFLTENIRFCPPAHCEVYLLADGIAIYAAEFIPTDFTLKTLFQTRLENALITVFQQGGVQLAFERENQAFTTPLPQAFQVCEAQFFHQFLLLCGEVRGQKKLLLFDENGQKILEEAVLSYSLSEEVLRAELPLCDRLCRTAKCTWVCAENVLKRTECVLSAPLKESEKNEAFLAYDFFESVWIGADFQIFLSETLQKDAEKILSFLGTFEGVILTDNPNVCGLIKRKSERLFEVAYFEVKIQNGKIIDVNG
ncbi:MAG: hypothetical protein IJV83_02700 [Clostridia bacterium]|nr:hypothetical protein [Clostridia bacterium]